MKVTKHYHKHYMYSCLSNTVAVVFYIFAKITPKNENLCIFLQSMRRSFMAIKNTGLPDHQGKSQQLSSTWAGQGPQSYCPTPAPLWWSLTLARNPQVCLKRPSPTYPCAEVKKQTKKLREYFSHVRHWLGCVPTEVWHLSLAYTDHLFIDRHVNAYLDPH